MSWVPGAGDPEGHFSPRNLPYGVFDTDSAPAPRVGVAIGDHVLDLAVLESRGLLRAGEGPAVFDLPNLNAFMARGPEAWLSVRRALTDLLDADNPRLRDDAPLRERALVARPAARIRLPIAVGGYTDFYASKEHAGNAGRMFRGPENALPANWTHLPIGYNGRASTVVVSGTDIHRPLGQTKPPGVEKPVFGPSSKLDIELEMGAVVGTGNSMGSPLTVDEAARAIFGYVLLNDWSARDIQTWEYVPLGPFQAKVFATSISPWVVSAEALAPFRVDGPAQDPTPLPYLRQAEPRNHDLHLETRLSPAAGPATTICRTNYRHMYWSAAQQLAHHAIGGCAMAPGDLLGSGTISGPDPGSLSSLLELTRNGVAPLALNGGGMRAFLEDGDTVTITGWCQGEGYRVGFGEVAGTILPAPEAAAWG